MTFLNCLAYSIVGINTYKEIKFMSICYEEVFAPESIRDMRNSHINSGEICGQGHMAFQVLKDFQGCHELGKREERQDEENGVFFRGDECNQFDENVTFKPLKVELTIKNYYRIVGFCVKMNMYLSLDMLNMANKLYDIYDRHGRLRRGVKANVSDDYNVYRIIDEETGENYTMLLQKIICNVKEIQLGYVYSIYKNGETPIKIGVTC